MAHEILAVDENGHYVSGAVTNNGALEVRNLRVDPSTNRLLVDALIDLGADVIDLATRDALAVGIVDANGDQITSFGGGVQYTEGDTDASITGTAIMWEDAADTLTPVNSSKPLPVTVITGFATSAKQDTIIGHVDGIEALLTTIDQALDNAISGNEMQVDVVAALPAGTNDIGRVGHNITGMGHGVTTVTTAGTDVALAGSTSCKRVVIQAQTDNTSLIAVGATGVDATIATGDGVVLYPGDAIELETDNLADIFIDSLVNGEGVRYTYFT